MVFFFPFFFGIRHHGLCLFIVYNQSILNHHYLLLIIQSAGCSKLLGVKQRVELMERNLFINLHVQFPLRSHVPYTRSFLIFSFSWCFFFSFRPVLETKRHAASSHKAKVIYAQLFFSLRVVGGMVGKLVAELRIIKP